MTGSARLKEKGEEGQLEEWNQNRKWEILQGYSKTLGWIFSSQTVVHSKMGRDAGVVIAQQRAHGDVLSCASDMLMYAAPWGWLILMLLWCIPFVVRGAGSARNKESHSSDIGSWGAVLTLELACLLWSLLWRINKTVAWIMNWTFKPRLFKWVWN